MGKRRTRLHVACDAFIAPSLFLPVADEIQCKQRGSAFLLGVTDFFVYFLFNLPCYTDERHTHLTYHVRDKTFCLFLCNHAHIVQSGSPMHPRRTLPQKPIGDVIRC